MVKMLSTIIDTHKSSINVRDYTLYNQSRCRGKYRTIHILNPFSNEKLYILFLAFGSSFQNPISGKVVSEVQSILGTIEQNFLKIRNTWCHVYSC